MKTIDKESQHLSAKIPANALNSTEKQGVLELLHSETFIDKTPYDVYYNLMDKGEYYCSPRTMYRILAATGETTDRRAQTESSRCSETRINCDPSK